MRDEPADLQELSAAVKAKEIAVEDALRMIEEKSGVDAEAARRILAGALRRLPSRATHPRLLGPSYHFEMANDFCLVASRAERGQRPERESMHLVLTEDVVEALARISSDLDTAGLAQIDPYNDTQWSPDEAALMGDRVERLYDQVVSRWDSAERPEDCPFYFFYGEVTDFLFWVRRVFMEAAERRMFVLAVGD